MHAALPCGSACSIWSACEASATVCTHSTGPKISSVIAAWRRRPSGIERTVGPTQWPLANAEDDPSPPLAAHLRPSSRTLAP